MSGQGSEFIGPPPPADPNNPPKPPSVWRVHFWKWVVLLAVLHFALAQAYSAVMPYRTPAVSYHQFLPDVGAPDERAHAQVISELVTTGQYPYFNADHPDFMDRYYQAHQPPLYYVATAVVLKATGQTNVESQSFGKVGRALNSLFGALNVAGCAALVWWFFAATKIHRARLALTAASFMALIPMNLALSGSINNDSLVFALITWAWAFAARSRLPGKSTLSLTICGLCLGLAVLTKFSALVAFPVAAFILLWRDLSPRQLLKSAATCLLALALVAPWIVRNLTLYGEPFLTKTFQEAFPKAVFTTPDTPIKAFRWLDRLLTDTAGSATGIFGYYDIHYPDWIQNTATWIFLVLVTFGALQAYKDGHRRHLLIGGTAVALFFAAYAVFNLRYFQPQARYVFPALPWLALGLAFGFQKLSPRIPVVYLCLYVVLNAATLPWLSFQYWLRTHPDEIAYRSIPADQRHKFPPPRPLEQTSPNNK